MSKFLAALAIAKPADSVPVADGDYEVEIVTAQVKPGDSVERVLRLDLKTLSAGQFQGRRQVKNQPLTAAGAAYVAALLEHTDLTEIATNTAMGEAFERGDDSVMRLFVGKRLKIRRKTKNDGSTEMTILAPEPGV